MPPRLARARHHATAYVFDKAFQAPVRMLLGYLPAMGVAVPEDRGGDGTGTDGIHPDAQGAELHSRCLGVVGEAGLGSGIEGIGGHFRPMRPLGRVVDDGTGALFAHDGRGMPGGDHGGAEEAPPGVLEAFFVHVFDVEGLGHAGRTAGVVEQDVEAIPLANRGADRPFDVLLAQDIRLHIDGRPRRLARLHLICLVLHLPPFFVAAAENNLGLLLAVGAHRGLSNAAGRSGNDRDLAVQSTRLSVSWLSGTSAKSTFSHQPALGASMLPSWPTSRERR